jgi:hypothetical protein
MGRPLAKRFFGNRNVGSISTPLDKGIGGEGVASIAVTGTFSGKTTATPFAVTISAPQIPGGVQAVATITFSSATAGTVTVTEKGSGYTAVPTATCALGGGTGNPTLTPVLTLDTGAVGSLTNQENAIIVRAKTTSAGSVLVGDIQAQKGTKRYKIKTANGIAICKLVNTATPLVNQACIQATDITGNSYFVMKLSSRKAVVVRKSGGSNYEFANPTTYPNGQIVKWTFGTAVLNKSVQIENA